MEVSVLQMLAVRTLIVVFLTGGLPFGTEAQNRLSQSRQMILSLESKDPHQTWLDSSAIGSIRVGSDQQPIERYYHFEDTLFSPWCDSIHYSYACGPCMDDHLGQLLSSEWYAIGNERYVRLRNWVTKNTYKGEVEYALSTVTVIRVPGEEVCGHVIIHLTTWTKEDRKRMLKAMSKLKQPPASAR